MTTGAFYGYYKSKDELFSALIGDVATMLMDRFKQAHRGFKMLLAEQQLSMDMSISMQYMDWTIDYIYDYFDAFKLLVCCAEGTEYENFIHELAEIEARGTREYITFLKEQGSDIREVDEPLLHIL